MVCGELNEARHEAVMAFVFPIFCDELTFVINCLWFDCFQTCDLVLY